MVKIAESAGVEVFAERDWEYTFLGSPFPAHRSFRALDIYQQKDFGNVALSPVEGEVFKVLEFDSPSLGTKSMAEYLTLIKSGDRIIKIMHIKPSVKEGERIHFGDEIGYFIKNGFFSFWVDAALHLEVRDLRDFIRAKGGYEIKPTIRKKIRSESVQEITGTVLKATERNIVVSSNVSNVVEVGGSPALVDGATSIGYCGVLGVFDAGEEVFFNGIRIGKIHDSGTYMSVFETEKLKVYVDEIGFAGLSFMLNSNRIRLLPERFSKPRFREGDKIKLRLMIEDAR